ncbi:hypothetical protein ADK65_29315 [Streptomyces sp. NRRL B-1140]|nr:hypothetical protein ADK65_29315 [Streptomyces sp. NRRL B-1140]
MCAASAASYTSWARRRAAAGESATPVKMCRPRRSGSVVSWIGTSTSEMRRCMTSSSFLCSVLVPRC